MYSNDGPWVFLNYKQARTKGYRRRMANRPSGIERRRIIMSSGKTVLILDKEARHYA